jgi:hypothetical protein
MIIKLIPETEAEKMRFKGQEEIEHANVKEYFFVGNKMDADGSLVDFHEWNGAYRYLIGTVGYFYEIINDERRRGMRQDEIELPSTIGKSSSPMIKRGEPAKIQKLDFSQMKMQPMNEGPKLNFKAKGDDGATIEDDFIDTPIDTQFKVSPGEEMGAEEDDAPQKATFTVEGIKNASKNGFNNK